MTIKCVQVGRLAFLDSHCTGGGWSVTVVSSAAVWSSHLSTNKMRFISSNQSTLWSCPLSVTSQLGEGCGTSFVRFVFLILWKTWVRNSFAAFSPMGFWRILQKCVGNFPRSTHMFICWRARKPGTRMKAQASCPNRSFYYGLDLISEENLFQFSETFNPWQG